MLESVRATWRDRGRRPNAWTGYVGALGIGAIATGISKVWLPGSFSLSIGVAIAAVFTRFADQFAPEIARSAHVRASWPDRLTGVRNGRLPLVGEVSDPTLLGVHPIGPPLGGGGAELPAYIHRDVDPMLREQIGRGGFILLIGESASGKTRTAYEAVRNCLPAHTLIGPLSRESIPAALQATGAHTKSVVWLDDLENYLGPDALSPVTVQQMLGGRGRALLMATMRAEEHTRYNIGEGSRLTGADRDTWRLERAVIQMATPLRLGRLWSPTERDRARLLSADPRIARALAFDDYGVAEALAAGPELAEAWRDAWAPGRNPRGAAIIAAAVDCRRMGLRRRLPTSWLRELHQPYLAAMGGDRLRPESFHEAITWAQRAVHATSALLTGDEVGGYSAFDYLLDIPRSEMIPDHLWVDVFPRLWGWILPRISAVEAYTTGLVAHRELRFSVAEEALRRAAAGAVPGADFALAVTLGDAGKHQEAIESLRRIRESRRRLPNADTAESLAIRHQIAYFRGERGERSEAARLFGLLAADAARELGPSHLDTLAARHQHAHFTGEAGDRGTALTLLRSLLDDRRRVLGAEHPHTLATERSLAWFTGLDGDLDAAIARLDALLLRAVPVLGPDDVHVFAARGALAYFTGRAGRPDAAVAQLTALRADRERVLGALHPHVLVTRQQLALFTAQAGDRDGAVRQIEQVVADMRRVLDASHVHLTAAEQSLTRLRNGGPVWVEGGGWS